MKKLIIGVLFTMAALAQEAPEYMKGAVITVKTKDGKEYKFSGDEYAVVIRSSMGKQKQSAPENNSQKQLLVERKRHIVKAYAGYGPKGLSTSKDSNSVTVEQDYDAVLGLGYTYMFSDSFGVGASYLTNHTELLDLEFNF